MNYRNINKKKFEDLVEAMDIATMSKVKECLASVEWEETAVRKALRSSDMIVNAIHTTSDGNVLEAVEFHCTVIFAANEIPGIRSAFVSHVSVGAYYDEETGRHSLEYDLISRGVASAENKERLYDVNFLYKEFCSNNPTMDIGEFISNDFDFATVCKFFKVAMVVNDDTGDLMYENDD